MNPTAAPERRSTAEKPPLRGLFITWGRLRRADTLAAHLGIASHSILYFKRGSRRTSLPLALLRYLLQAVHTLGVCLRYRPRVVFVTHPPLFAILPVYLYAGIFRARFVVDIHSGCFVQEHWRRWDRWQRFLARRAAFCLVHNADNAKTVEGWGARYEILPSLPPDLRVSGCPEHAASGRPPRVVYICSFKEDEPVGAVIEAARGLPEAEFRITGRAPRGLEASLPGNVRLTGFLSDDEYNELLAGADALVALTTRQGTLLYGAQEALALHRPLLVSRTATLEEYFGRGALFCDNTAEDIRRGVREMLSRREELSAAMAAFHEQYLAEGEERLERIRRRLERAG